MFKTQKLWMSALGLMVFAAMVAGCGGGESASAPQVPAEPDKTVEAVADSLAKGELDMLWAAMPASYQADVTALVHGFADAVDKEVYDQSFVVLGKLADVLASKKQYILNHPMMAENPSLDQAEFKANYDKAVDAIQTLIASSINTVDGLKQVDIGAYLADEGRAIGQNIAALAESQEDNAMAKIATVTAKVIETKDGVATVEMTDPDGHTETEQMVQVEGRWVPKEMADEWSESIAEAKAELATMKAEGMPNKPMVMGMLAGFGAALDQLAAAESQEAFNQALDGLLGGFGGMLVPGPQ